MSRSPRTFHITALAAALCSLGVVAFRRQIEHWPVIEFVALLAAGLTIASMATIILKGLSPRTPAEFSASITTTTFYIWTGGKPFSGMGELLYAGVLLLIAIFAWLVSWYGVRACSSTTSAAELDGGGQPTNGESDPRY